MKPVRKRKRLGEKYILNLRKRALLGVIDILIMHWIKKQPICGQDIKNKIHKEFGLNISPGTMYPILYNLQNKGFVESKIYHKKRVYFLTKKGLMISVKVKNDYFKVQKSIHKFLSK